MIILDNMLSTFPEFCFICLVFYSVTLIAFIFYQYLETIY